MTDEQQAAYNEWLIKYGYGWVDRSVLRVDRPLFWCSIPANTMNNYVRCSIQKYQLKTPEELQNEITTETP